MRAFKRRTWCDALPFGLPDDFDFRNIRTGADALHFILPLPNSNRGTAAKLLYENRHIVGNSVVYRGLLEAWSHDHRWVLAAFGSDIAFAAALREVSPPMKAEGPILAWRGVDDIDAAAGLSWTTDRDVACFFAVRSPQNTPLVLRYEFQPEDIVARYARYNGRRENELIIDPFSDFDRVVLDDGSGSYACDIVDHEEVLTAGIASWQAGYGRYSTFMKGRNALRLRAALRNKQRLRK